MKNMFKCQEFIIKNSSNILTGIAVGGVISTWGLSIRDTKKAIQIDKKNISDKEKTRMKIACYIPSVSVALSTIGCVIGARVLDSRKQASLTSAYIMLDSVFRQYRKNVDEVLDEENSEKLYRAAVDKVHNLRNDLSDIDIKSIDRYETRLFYDKWTGTYFESTIDDVEYAQIMLNLELQSDVCVSLNDFYDYLNLSPTEIGCNLYWDDVLLMEENKQYITFNNRIVKNAVDNIDIIFIECDVEPVFYDMFSGLR